VSGSVDSDSVGGVSHPHRFLPGALEPSLIPMRSPRQFITQFISDARTRVGSLTSEESESHDTQVGDSGRTTESVIGAITAVIGFLLAPFPETGLWERYRSQSFLTKVAIGAAIVISVTLITGGLMAVQTGNLLEESTEDDLIHSTELQNGQTSLWLDTMTQQTQFISASQAIESGEQGASEAYLESQLESVPDDVTAIHYVKQTSDGSEVIASTADGSGEGPNGWSGVLESADFDSSDEVVMSDVYTNTETGTTSLDFVTPIETQENHAIAMTVDLQQASLRLDAPENGQSFVVTEDGSIVLSSIPGDVGGDAYNLGYFTESEWAAVESQSSMFSSPTFSEDTTINGDSYVSGAVYSGNGDWVVVTQEPQSVAYELVDSTQNSIALLIGVVLGASMLVAMLIGIPMFRDLRHLDTSAKKVRDGNYDENVELQRGDELGSVANSMDEMRASLKNRIDEVEGLHDRMGEIVQEQCETLSRASNGDLTARMSTDVEIEQFEDLAKDFNDMMDDIDAAVAEAKKFGEEVGESSQEATSGIQEVRDASTDVSGSTQEISDGAFEQNQKLDQVSGEMNNLSSTIEQVASSADQVAAQAEETADASQQGRDAAEDAADALNTIENRTETAVDTVSNLSSQLEEVHQVVQNVSEIAEETNMLALNASIEAARAGKSGDGFAVVAERVKTLSDDAATAADEIEDSIEKLQQESDTTVDDIEQTQKAVDRGSETIEEALEELDNIAEAVDETVTGVKEIDDVTERQAETAQEVVTMIDEVSEISEETASQAEDVASASEEQTASLAEVSRSSEQMAERSMRLNDLLDNFEADTDTDIHRNNVFNQDPGEDSDSEEGGDADDGDAKPYESGSE